MTPTDRLFWRPIPRWRWWLTWGANETALMYPRGEWYERMAESMRSLAVAFGNQLLPSMRQAADAMSRLVLAYGADHG